MCPKATIVTLQINFNVDICHVLNEASNITLLYSCYILKKVINLLILLFFVVSTLLYNMRFSYFVYQYHFNNKVFTESYCINKDKPELKCNGKCELAKLAKAAEKQEQKNKTISEKEIDFIIPSFDDFSYFSLYYPQLKFYSECNLYSDFLQLKNYPPPKLNSYLA
jgi:hypothetical protein